MTLPVAMSMTLPTANAIPINTNKRRQESIQTFLEIASVLPEDMNKKLRTVVTDITLQDDLTIDNINKLVQSTTAEMDKLQDMVSKYSNKEKEKDEKIIELQHQLEEKKVEPIYCTVCLTDVHELISDGTTLIQCNKSHVVCADCANHKITNMIIAAPDDGVLLCGYDGCTGNLSGHVNFKSVIDKSTLANWKSACTEARIRKEYDEMPKDNTTQTTQPAFVCKRPCCGKPMPLNFDGCMSFDCPDCTASFCGCCMKVFKPKGNNLAENNVLFRTHEHVSTCKYNTQPKDEDGRASYDVKTMKQKNLLECIWMKYFLVQKLSQTMNMRDIRSLLGTKADISILKPYCVSVGLPSGPYGYVGELPEEVIILD